MQAVEQAEMEQDQGQEQLTPALVEFIEKWKDTPGNLVMVLHRVQQEFGYVPRPVAFQVADLLKTPLAQVYGVLTFYHFFKLKKPGRFQVQVCMGTACYLKGGKDLLSELQSILGVEEKQVTKDGLFSVEAVRCLGCCGMAPVLAVNGELHGNLRREDIPGVIAQYKAKARAEDEVAALSAGDAGAAE